MENDDRIASTPSGYERGLEDARLAVKSAISVFDSRGCMRFAALAAIAELQKDPTR